MKPLQAMILILSLSSTIFPGRPLGLEDFNSSKYRTERPENTQKNQKQPESPQSNDWRFFKIVVSAFALDTVITYCHQRIQCPNQKL